MVLQVKLSKNYDRLGCHFKQNIIIGLSLNTPWTILFSPRHLATDQAITSQDVLSILKDCNKFSPFLTVHSHQTHGASAVQHALQSYARLSLVSLPFLSIGLTSTILMMLGLFQAHDQSVPSVFFSYTCVHIFLFTLSKFLSLSLDLQVPKTYRAFTRV